MAKLAVVHFSVSFQALRYLHTGREIVLVWEWAFTADCTKRVTLDFLPCWEETGTHEERGPVEHASVVMLSIRFYLPRFVGKTYTIKQTDMDPDTNRWLNSPTSSKTFSRLKPTPPKANWAPIRFPDSSISASGILFSQRCPRSMSSTRTRSIPSRLYMNPYHDHARHNTHGWFASSVLQKTWHHFFLSDLRIWNKTPDTPEDPPSPDEKPLCSWQEIEKVLTANWD